MHFRLANTSAGRVTAEIPTQPIDSMPSSIAGVTLKLYLVKRQHDAVLVVFALQVDPSAASIGLESSIDQALSYNASSTFAANPIETVSNVGLVDPVGLKEYLPFMSDPKKDTTCLCSTLSGGPYDEEHRTVTNYLAAIVAAPPPSVKSVAFVSGMGSFANVPLG